VEPEDFSDDESGSAFDFVGYSVVVPENACLSLAYVSDERCCLSANRQLAAIWRRQWLARGVDG
jgi:hypothetical protein